MPSEVKQRKRSPNQKPGAGAAERPAAAAARDGAEGTATPAADDVEPRRVSSPSPASVDVKTFLCVLSLAACAALTRVVLQQNERFSELEQQYTHLNGRTAALFNAEEEVLKVSEKCQSVQVMLEGLGGQRGAVRPQLEGLERDVVQLRDWATESTEKRAQHQSSLAALREAVGQIEERTAAITKDVANKVASVRTDVRRMDGLRSEVESLLAQVGELEDKMAQAERTMVKRIGDVLSGSIDRVAALRASSERNTQALDKLQRRLPELAAADRQISERLQDLESGRARLIRTLDFASDLKTKVAAVKRDFGALEPQLSDLTLRIGRLAEDLTQRERDIAELRQTLANLTAVEGDTDAASRQVDEIADNMPDVGEMLFQSGQ